MQNLESSRPKPGRMEETPKGGQGPPWAVAPLERERERERETFMQPLLLWKTISITHSKSVFVALGIQHAKLMCYIVTCGLIGTTITLHIS